MGDGELGAKVGELGGKVGESGREGGVRARVCLGEVGLLVSLSVSRTTSSSLSSGIWPWLWENGRSGLGRGVRGRSSGRGWPGGAAGAGGWPPAAGEAGVCRPGAGRGPRRTGSWALEVPRVGVEFGSRLLRQTETTSSRRMPEERRVLPRMARIRGRRSVATAVLPAAMSIALERVVGGGSRTP
jgi:hypothetical protein